MKCINKIVFNKKLQSKEIMIDWKWPYSIIFIWIWSR